MSASALVSTAHAPSSQAGQGVLLGMNAFGFLVPGDCASGGTRQERPAADCGG